MAAKLTGKASGEFAVSVDGLRETQAALKKLDADAARELRAELKAAGKEVEGDARGNVRSRSGKLAGSIKTSVTAKGVSVYSNLVYARVQDQGGKVGRNHATLLARGSVSQYMKRAGDTAEPKVTRRLERMLDRLDNDFGGK